MRGLSGMALLAASATLQNTTAADDEAKARLSKRAMRLAQIAECSDERLRHLLAGLEVKEDAFDPGEAGGIAFADSTSSWATQEPSGDSRLSLKGEILSVPSELHKLLARPGKLTLEIDSTGGSIVPALEILSLIADRVSLVKINYALSAAAVIGICAPCRRIMSKTGRLMLHEPWLLTMGPAEVLRANANILEDTTSQLVTLVQKRTGLPRFACSKLFRCGQTWVRPEQALELNLIDEIS